LAKGIGMSAVIDSMFKQVAIQKSIETKRKEIEKRREVMETTSSTNVSRKKDEAKIEAIDSKISSKVNTIDKTIDYYKNEIEKSDKKFNNDIDNLRKKIETEVEKLEKKFNDDKEIVCKKLETEIEKLESKFTLYRSYCQDGIRREQEKKDLLTEPLEKKKELLQQIMEKSEEDDKVLVRLKVEMKQLQEEEKETQKRYLEECKLNEEKLERQRQTIIYENKLLMRQQELVEEAKRQKQFEELSSQRAAEKAADEERWARQKEERIKEASLEKEKNEQKEKRLAARNYFLTTIFPSLSDKAAKIYNFFKNSDDDVIYKEAIKMETVDECEKYLFSNEDTYDLITDFEEKKYPKISQESQDEYDNKTLWQKVKFLKQQNKKK